MKKEEMKEGRAYTLIGTTMLQTTGMRQFVFREWRNDGKAKVTMKSYSHMDKRLKPVGEFFIEIKDDQILLNGYQREHGISTDSLLPTKAGLCFTVNTMFNLCHENIEVFKSYIEQHTTEEQRSKILFYQITNNQRAKEGLALFSKNEY